jgi:hypothetical protein
MKKHAGHGYHKTEITHHTDGSHSVTHHVHPDHMHEMKDMSYAKGDLDGVHDGVQENLGTPNPGENEGAEGEKLEEAIHPGIHAAVSAAQGAQ